jgi:FkbM family methyltransferase
MLPDNRIYYAQNREDLILESFFGDVKNGFYVDVGACHPHVASVTKRFYLKGWRGINIEPQTNLYHLFEAERKRDINLNIGISDKDSTLTLRMYTDNQGLSTIAPDVKHEHESRPGNKTERYEDVAIPVTTLQSVLQHHKPKTIHFLKVDVEGYEYEVLKGNDWTAFRPEVICVEANHVLRDWRPLLKKHGYGLVFFDGLNEYYADTKIDRAQKFKFVDHVVLDLKGGIAADDYDVLSESKQALAHETEATRQLQTRLGEATKELASVKRLLTRLARVAPSNIRAKLIPKKR